ncbi:MAG: hypothetical protein ACYSWQ_25370 [Planctomycetota bacterium]|jgi:hypothetical protein
MRTPENDSWLDEALSKAIGSAETRADFERWKRQHPQAVGMLTARASKENPASPASQRIRKRIMKSPITKLAAAAVIVIAAVLSMSLWEKTTPATYALEQTIEASHSVRYLRIRDFKPGEDEPKEFWLEFDQQGGVKNIRGHMPEWESPSDGEKVVIWRDRTAEIWFKRKNMLVMIKEDRLSGNMLAAIQLFDPKWAVQRFAEMERLGLAEVEIEEPSKETKPITVTATYSPECKQYGLLADRTVLFVDQATKLVTDLESYSLAEGGGYESISRTEFHDYNQRIDPAVFVMDDVPSDVVRIDKTVRDIGLEQGNLSDKEIAVKIVREFYEAVIAKDHAKAGRLYGNFPAAGIEEKFRDLKILRIISIDEPKLHPTPGVGGFMVPCKLEIEKDGIKSVYEPYGPGVRPVPGRPNRWSIHGGITK